ncbi:galactose-3-O-sulfotransferase 2-like [Saccoglossus kowalevskii]
MQPITNIVYIKTHKTGSTSLHCIICRYGYDNKLSFLFSKENTKNGYFRKTALNPLKFLPPLGGANNKTWKYNILSGHVTYSRNRMDSLMEENTKYITILREPARQIESHMNFFKLRKNVMAGISLFTRQPSNFENGGKSSSRNNQIRDLGLTLGETSNETFVNETIETLNKEFDLVLITEYFDESLVLLTRLFHWSVDDVIYLAKNQRVNREIITDELRHQIYQWSRADVLLYRYFNETLWRRISEYGPEFEDDLAFLRSRLLQTNKQCNTSEAVEATKLKIKRVEYVSANFSMYCQELTRLSMDWYKHIAIRQDPTIFGKVMSTNISL